jgi:hypothetical protein
MVRRLGRSAGLPVCWSAGLLVRWSAGPLVRWSAGPLVRIPLLRVASGELITKGCDVDRYVRVPYITFIHDGRRRGYTVACTVAGPVEEAQRLARANAFCLRT